MTSRLQQLLVSFNDILDQYCMISPKAEPFIIIEEGFCDKELHSPVNLESCIKSATENNIRAPLMYFVLYGLNQVKSLFEHPKVLDEEAALKLQQALAQLMVDMQRLLNTSQSIQLDIQYGCQNVRIHGSLNLGGGLSKSGQLIHDNLFVKFNLPVNAKVDDIKQFITDIINDHQCRYLLQENKYLRLANSTLSKNLQEARELLRAKDLAEAKALRNQYGSTDDTSSSSNWLSLFG